MLFAYFLIRKYVKKKKNRKIKRRNCFLFVLYYYLCSYGLEEIFVLMCKKNHVIYNRYKKIIVYLGWMKKRFYR